MTLFREIKDPQARVYAVGDLHGCAEELQVLLDRLEGAEMLGTDDLVVFIGDYVDRGLNSQDTVELLIQFAGRHNNSVFLKGNHEDMLLDFLGFGGTLGNSYIANGGAQTLASYGVPLFEPAKEARQRFPETHVEFLLNLDAGVITKDYIFVHAGLNPGRSIEEQATTDLYWIRDEFLFEKHNFGRLIVFGHTPHQDLLFHWPYKIGIDTGCVFGNMLSCVELKEKKVLQILKGDKQIMERKFPAFAG